MTSCFGLAPSNLRLRLEDASDATVTDDGFQHHVGGLLLPDEQYHCTIVTSTHATTTSEPERSISSYFSDVVALIHSQDGNPECVKYTNESGV